MSFKKNLFIFVGSIPVVLLVYFGQPFLGVVVALLVMALVIFLPAFQAPRPDQAPETTATKPTTQPVKTRY